MAAAPTIRYRQSYVEKDRCVRNSTAAPVPGVDVLQGFTLSKSEFEHVFLQAAESMDDPSRLSNVDTVETPSNPAGTSRFGRSRKQQGAGRQKQSQQEVAAPNISTTAEAGSRGVSDASSHPPSAQDAGTKAGAGTGSGTSAPATSSRGFRAGAGGGANKAPDPHIGSPEDAADYADMCRKHAASLQRSAPADYDGAGEFFERACDARARHGLFCSPDNADAHVEYAQNLSKRGLTPEAEYHLRTAADIYRMLDARAARKYGDVLLYLAVVVDRQARLAEAENFYRSALAVYRANKLSDDNVRVAIDSLSNNLRAQGRGDEVDSVVRRHFLGALD